MTITNAVRPIILTYTGARFNILKPDPTLVRIEDIANSLSKLCRYTGHSNAFYSVAEHSIRVSEMVPEQHSLRGLLHDATEAYVGDMSFPLKHQPSMAPYLEVEAAVWRAICTRFGLSNDDPWEVKAADRECCRQEGTQLIAGWRSLPESYDAKPTQPSWRAFDCLTHQEAYYAFMDRFEALCAKHK